MKTMTKSMAIFLTAVVLCLSLCTMVSSFPRDIFLASKTIKTLSAPDFRLCKDQQKFLRGVEEQQSRWLFHLRGPITTEKKVETETLLGIKLGGYVPHNTFVVLATKEQAEKAMSTPHVLWVGAYLPEYKLSPEFKTLTEELGTKEKTYSRTTIRLAHDDIATEEAHSHTFSQWTEHLSSVVSVSFTRLSKTSSVLKLRAEIPAEVLHKLLEKLSHMHQIVWIEPVGFLEPATKWSVRFEQSANPTFSGDTVYKSKGISGKSQTVAILDTNFDRSNCFLPKFDINCVEGFEGSCSTGDSAHGTAMASIIFGNSTQFSEFSGYAPDSTPALFSIGTSGNDGTETSLSTTALAISRAYLSAAGKSARVFVAGFAGSSKLYDIFAETADNDAVNNQQTLLIFPAGNNGRAGVSGIASPGLSKNALVVGSSQNAIEALKNDISKVPEAGRANVQNTNLASLFGKNSLSSFSTRGPTSDMRYKPDVVFPGEVIYTAASGSCGTSVSSGTSLAAAGAAGAAALAADYFAQGFYPEGAANSGNRNSLTSPQLKALLIASAVPITVADDAGPLGALSRVRYYDTAPNGAFGFGRVQLSNILHINGTDTKKFFIDQNTTRSVGTGQSYKYCVRLLNPGDTLKATLTWVDPLSTTGTSFALVNNLDLVIVQASTGREWRANGGETYDNTNNVEVVSLVAPTNGTYVVIVHGTSVPSGSQQVFSVVITGNLDPNADFNGLACAAGLQLQCPNGCSSNGNCVDGLCQCKSGFNGPDCSFTLCPYNCRGSSDESVVTASKGVCDLTTGKCICDSSHTGEYCQTFISNIPPTQTVETGHSKNQTILAVVLAAVGGIVLGLILGFFVSKVVMERQRKQRREELLKGNQKF